MPDTAITPRKGPDKSDLDRSRDMIDRLGARKLPQMVDWFDPILLAKVGVRTVISKTIGDYADQRPMQASADRPKDEQDLCQRHDYRALGEGSPAAKLGTDGRLHLAAAPDENDLGERPVKSLKLDPDGALWVDFIADLGDGFEATYAMAYLIAGSKLHVDDMPKDEAPYGLPAGEFLIFGGDLAYPDATIKEYNDRCIAPYSAAYQLKEGETPKRKLFFISGNHDWYDGLAAFTSVFCAARDRFSMGKGKVIGGWQCEQRRSYFALGLPYRWWIWGVDLALSDTVDDAQKDYFELMSNQTEDGDKIIIILHAPIWQLKEDYSHLIELSELARNRGAELVAVLAGDLHFYSRYHTQSKKLDLQLITSGGGGAFAHPTHQEALTRKIKWTIPKDAERLPHVKKDYEPAVVTATADDETPRRNIRRAFLSPEAHDFHAPAHFYPTRLKSRLLALKNLWLPLHNRRLALFIGVVYMIYAWVFQITVADPTIAIRNAQFVQAEMDCRMDSTVNKTPESLRTCADGKKDEIRKNLKAVFTPKPVAAASGTAPAPAAGAPTPTATAAAAEDERKKTEIVVGYWKKISTAYTSSSICGSCTVARILLNDFYDVIAPSFSPTRITRAMLANPVFFFMIFGLWAGLVYYVDATSKIWLFKWPVKLVLGTVHFASHLALLLATNALFDIPYQAMTASDSLWVIVTGVSIYTFLMLMIGGFIGGAVFGLYSASTSFVAGMHMDAFSAIGIKDYKNFLRMKFDKNGGLTIYAIGLDKIPGRRGWRAIDPKRDQAEYDDHNPLIVPVDDLKPRLIDKIAGQPVGNGWKWGGSA